MKAKAISNTDAETLKGFVHSHVELGSTVYTDDHRGYLGLHGVLYNHSSVKHFAKECVNGMIHTNGIESVWAIIKRGYSRVKTENALHVIHELEAIVNQFINKFRKE